MESRDILNYTLTVAVLILTVLVSWILIYIIRIFRQFEHAIKEVTNAIDKFTTVLDYAKEKIASAAAVLPLLMKGAEKIVEMVSSFRERRRAASEASENKTKNKKTRAA